MYKLMFPQQPPGPNMREVSSLRFVCPFGSEIIVFQNYRTNQLHFWLKSSLAERWKHSILKQGVSGSLRFANIQFNIK